MKGYQIRQSRLRCLTILRFSGSIVALFGRCCVAQKNPVLNPEDFPNPLAGTFGNEQHHSMGNTLPIIARPFGFNHWAPATTLEDTSWWFSGDSDVFRGIRCTHQPSPWIGDYGQFMISPELGYPDDRFIGFVQYRGSTMKPYLMDFTMGPANTKLALTPTDHGAVLRVEFPKSTPPLRRRVCVWVPKKRYGFEGDEDFRRARQHGQQLGNVRAEDKHIELISRRNSGGVLMNEGEFAFFATLQADGLEDGSNIRDPLGAETAPDLNERGSSACFHLGSISHIAEVRIGTSFISQDQAKNALQSEIGMKTFDEVLKESRAAWNQILSRVEVTDAGPMTEETSTRLQIFYNSLYRALLFPRRLDELTPDGVRHWSPYSGLVHSGPSVTDNGFWDTFRTVYPLLGLLYPEQLAPILMGWLNAYREGGWLPKWASPGYRGSMVGTFADVSVADAIVKNISGIDFDLAWEAMWKDAESDGDDKGHGRLGGGVYRDRGFIPIDVGIPEACSRTLDFGFADAAIAAAAEKLGKKSEAQILRTRSEKAMRNLYEPSSRLMKQKRSDGRFMQFQNNDWGHGFTEGSVWHHSFPPYNVSLLSQLHGGNNLLMAKVREFLETKGDFGVGSYGQEIHEMREMRMLGMGQYSHSNQPVHHILYLFTMMGEQNATAKYVRHSLQHFYGTDFFAGDEDNGEMASWYVLSALGLYDPNPGVDENYVLGAVPLFQEVKLKALGITVQAPAAQEHSPDITEVRWNDKKVTGTRIAYSELRKGGTLLFVTPDDKKVKGATGSSSGSSSGGSSGGSSSSASPSSNKADATSTSVHEPLHQPDQSRADKWAAKASKMGEKVGRVAGRVAEAIAKKADGMAKKEAQIANKLRKVAHIPTVAPAEGGGTIGILICGAGLGIAAFLVSKVFGGAKKKGKKAS